MSVVSLPTGIAVGYAGGFSWGQERYELAGMADVGGATQVRPLGPPRWSASIRAPQAVPTAEAVVWEALLLSLRGRVNHLAVYDVNRPAPRGTLRGAPRLQYALAAGDNTMTLVGGTAGTLAQGDPLQLGSGVGTSQLVRLVADAVSNPSSSGTFAWDNGGAFVWDNSGTFVWSNPGTITVTFEPPARIDFPLDTVVTWDKPVAYMKQVNDGTSWSYYNTKIQQGFALDLLEDWTP